MTGDLENTGYDIKPEDGIYGTGGTTLYDLNKDIDFVDGKFTTDITPYKIAAESIVADSIKSRFGSKIGNITIYQESHHGINVAPDAVETMGLNRSNGIYAVAPSDHDIAKRNLFRQSRTYYYALADIPADHKMYAGENNSGVTCAINQSGATTCGYTAPVYAKRTLIYDANGGTDAPEAGVCTTSNTSSGAACGVEITNAGPVKDGYTFIGWASSRDAIRAEFVAGDSVGLSDNRTLYAVYQLEKSAQEVSFESASVDKAYGDDVFINVATTTGDGTITYSSDNDAVATVDSRTGAVTIRGVGIATITATASGTEYYYEATGTYNLTVRKGTVVPDTGDNLESDEKSLVLNVGHIIFMGVAVLLVIGGYILRAKKNHRKFDQSPIFCVDLIVC